MDLNVNPNGIECPKGGSLGELTENRKVDT